MPILSPSQLTTLLKFWKVLLIFLTPWGLGIPAGVLVAKTEGLPWSTTTLLYLLSDIILALAFEPLLLLFIASAKRIQFLAKLSAAMKQNTKKITEQYGNVTGPFALVMVSFVADPMTGRSLAVAAGHGFFTGWLIAITGDMITFAVLMISTLCLNNLLGDGTWTSLIIFVLMLGVPAIIRKFRKPKTL